MEEKYECPNCKQTLPFGKLTDVCPKCTTRFGYSSPFQPELARRGPIESIAERDDSANPEAIKSLLESSSTSPLIGKFFRLIRVVFGALFFLAAVFLAMFAHELHLVSHDRADLYVPGTFAFIGACLVFAKSKASTLISSLMGVLAMALIWFVLALIGAAAFSK